MYFFSLQFSKYFIYLTLCVYVGVCCFNKLWINHNVINHKYEITKGVKAFCTPIFCMCALSGGSFFFLFHPFFFWFCFLFFHLLFCLVMNWFPIETLKLWVNFRRWIGTWNLQIELKMLMKIWALIKMIHNIFKKKKRKQFLVFVFKQAIVQKAVKIDWNQNRRIRALILFWLIYEWIRWIADFDFHFSDYLFLKLSYFWAKEMKIVFNSNILWSFRIYVTWISNKTFSKMFIQ